MFILLLNCPIFFEIKLLNFLVSIPMVDKIIVKAVIGKNRSGIDTQVGHSFDIYYKRAIVGDVLEYNDDKNKKKGYKIKLGKNLQKTKMLNSVTAKAGRVWKKKIK